MPGGCIAAVLWAFPAAAQEASYYSRAQQRCMDQSSGATSELMACLGDELKRQDLRLNQAYQRLMQQQTPQRAQALRSTQRLWIQYRDANCGFYQDPESGSILRLASASCELRMTAERADEMETLFTLLH